MLVELPKSIPIYNPTRSSFYLEGLYRAAECYLHLGNTTATVQHTQGKFHLVTVETHQKTLSTYALCALKILSYTILLFPLIAFLIKTAGRACQHYCYHKPEAQAKDSVFIKAFAKTNLDHMKLIYALDQTAINHPIPHPKYGPISPFLAACLQEDLPTLAWLLNVQGREILTQPHQGNAPLVLACAEGKQETVQWLITQGCDPSTTTDSRGVELFFLTCQQESPEIAWILLQHNHALLNRRNAAGLTPFAATLASLPQNKTTTSTLQWLYNRGAGRGLFIEACRHNQLAFAKQLFNAIGEPILHEVNEQGMNHFERACYDGNLRLVSTFFDAANGAVQNIHIEPHHCKGGVLRFIYQNNIV